jgi:holin-like protein
MRYLKQFWIILCISFIGEILNKFIPLPVPASIYGIVLMFVCLCTGIIKLNQVKDAADFLVQIMPVMFIPAAAGLIDSWSVIRPSILSYIAVTVISTVFVMAVSGIVTQLIMRAGKRRNSK